MKERRKGGGSMMSRESRTGTRVGLIGWFVSSLRVRSGFGHEENSRVIGMIKTRSI